MPELAMVNSNVSAIDDAVISINDRGLLFGDAVYEVIVAYKGELFLLDGHMRRLRRSLREMDMLDLVDLGEIRRQIGELLKASGLLDAKIYLQISRGSAPRAHQYPDKPCPNVFITVRKLERAAEEKFKKGVAMITVPDERWSRCDIKTVCLLANVRAKQAAIKAGVFDALFVAQDGMVREATAANAFMVKAGVVCTHPKRGCILGGITRDHVMKLAKRDGIKVVEKMMTIDDYLSADEVFLTGTTTEVMPVVLIDGHRIKNGKPGGITKRLHELFLGTIPR